MDKYSWQSPLTHLFALAPKTGARHNRTDLLHKKRKDRILVTVVVVGVEKGLKSTTLLPEHHGRPNVGIYV